ncbi:mandelate racemase/muconate lactonizing enzyme family protein [Candidatus Poribacteria bacterium]|nr:mandelate racemase/muconate lactonizing enzyme family protein [Candidatus Poribacteria bacterium]
MKIVDYKIFLAGNPWKNWIYLKLYTDEGITGVSEATGGLYTMPVVEQINELSRVFVGQDPRNPEKIYDAMYKALFLDTNIAMSAVEIACWDIIGKMLDAPVWQLLGGKTHDKLRAYANGWYQGPRDPVFFAERANQVVEMGYTALKFDPFGGAYRFISRDSEKLAINIVKAVRDAVGEDVDILVEGHDRFSVSTAIRIGNALEEFNPMWFETPVQSKDMKALTAVAKGINVPVASGEMLERRGDFVDMLEERVIDIVQPETLHVGGISGCKKVSAIAEAYEAFIACHQAQSPLNTAINAHIHVTLPNFLIQECFDDFLEPWSREIMTGVPQVKDGYLEVSDKPGLGVEIHEEELAKHPYGQTHFLRLFEEGWERRD